MRMTKKRSLAIKQLNAELIDGKYYYFSDDSINGDWYPVLPIELTKLGARLQKKEPNAYSYWCNKDVVTDALTQRQAAKLKLVDFDIEKALEKWEEFDSGRIVPDNSWWYCNQYQNMISNNIFVSTDFKLMIREAWDYYCPNAPTKITEIYTVFIADPSDGDIMKVTALAKKNEDKDLIWKLRYVKEGNIIDDKYELEKF